jgi:SAM-dependent methyltransferase
MNDNHARVCPSPEWAAYLQEEVLPWLTAQADLGDDMLEIGPGPGAATQWLRHKVKRLTAVEVDADAAALLAAKLAGSNVEIRTGDATRLGFADDSFDSVGCFTMLHHVPTRASQNAILAQALRVLRPGGVLIGSDSLASNDLHHFHADDTYNPIEPASLLTRLAVIGFGAVTVRADYDLRFVACKPAPPAEGVPEEAST